MVRVVKFFLHLTDKEVREIISNALAEYIPEELMLSEDSIIDTQIIATGNCTENKDQMVDLSWNYTWRLEIQINAEEFIPRKKDDEGN